MSFEAQLKIRYAEAHQRLVYPTLKPVSNPVTEPKRIKKPIKPVEYSPLFTDSKPTIYDLLRWVSAVEGPSVAEIKGPRHSKPIALARHIVCYLARIYAGLSLPQIGRVLDRDHTTVLNGVNRIKVMRLTSADLCQRLAFYEKRLDPEVTKNLQNYRRCQHCGAMFNEVTPHSSPQSTKVVDHCTDIA